MLNAHLRILAGQQFITPVPDHVRQRMADMHITRLLKTDSGSATFETIDDPADVVKLAGRHAPLDVVEQFAIDTARDEALDAAGYYFPPDKTRSTRNAIRAIMAKPGWSSRELKMVRGMLRALVNPRPRPRS